MSLPSLTTLNGTDLTLLQYLNTEPLAGDFNPLIMMGVPAKQGAAKDDEQERTEKKKPHDAEEETPFEPTKRATTTAEELARGRLSALTAAKPCMYYQLLRS